MTAEGLGAASAAARAFDAPDGTPPRGAVQDFYADAFAQCFGCGRLNPEGHRLRSFPAGDGVVARVLAGPHDTSFPGFAYGGYIASLLDCHSIAAAASAAHTSLGKVLGVDALEPFVTGSLKVDFVRPTPIAGPLDLAARAVSVDGRKVAVHAQLAVDGVVRAKAEVIAVKAPAAMRAHGSM